MTSVASLRTRFPFVVFIFALILLVAVLGFVCLCMSDHPGQTLERLLQAFLSLPPLILVWGLAFAAARAAALGAVPAVASKRASPASLQRFLL